MSLLSMTWFFIGIFLLFAVAFRRMAGGRDGVGAVLSLFISALASALRLILGACAQIGNSASPNNSFVALVVQLALLVAMIVAVCLLVQPNAQSMTAPYASYR
ncbi:MAG TPA: hypothetical protein V6C81_27025 [Planktothrix sp.]|jgi:hypothetical protein